MPRAASSAHDLYDLLGQNMVLLARGRHSPIHEGTWWTAKIGILPYLVDSTDFPVDSNGFKGRFELLSASRIQRNSQIQLLIKNEKLDLTTYQLVLLQVR